jgi:hypothetical protein
VARIEDVAEAATLRRQATRVWRESLAIAVIGTAVTMIARGLFDRVGAFVDLMP